MTAMVDQVKAALAVSVFPSVIARGGELAVQGIKEGVVLLAMRGSPGAVLPLLSRIEALLRATVPGVTGVQLVYEDRPAREEMAAIDIAARVRHLLDAELNPNSAAITPPHAALSRPAPLLSTMPVGVSAKSALIQ